MKRIWLGLVAGLIGIVMLAIPVLAIALPSSTPSLNSPAPASAFRNVLQTGDILLILYENTPYTTAPTTQYKDAFIWRWMDTDNTTELAQSTGFTFNANGYGYNVIGFYLNAANVTAKGITWGTSYPIRLSGTPTAFTTPPIYNFMPSINYDSATSTTTVKADIATLIIELALDLDAQWGLSGTSSLVSQTEAGQALSASGQAFFRGAIFGLQAMAPAAFDLNIGNIDNTGYVASANGTAYASNLSAQHTGDPIGTALQSGQNFLNVGYNLFGLLVVLGMMGVIIVGHWSLAGGNLWRGLIESAGPVVISSRIGIMGLGELAVVVAICWLYICAKIWRLL